MRESPESCRLRISPTHETAANDQDEIVRRGNVLRILDPADYMVARRTNEIGIRIALGATPGEVLGMIMRDAGLLFAIGAVAGTLLAGFGAGAAKALLFGLKPWDLRVLLSAAAVLGAVAFVASYWPAHRAARLQPMTALREE